MNEARVELAVTDIDSPHAQCAVLEHHVGEASGARADVEAHAVRRVERERGHHADELQSAARDVRARVAVNLDLGVDSDEGAGLVDALVRPRKYGPP